MPIFIQGIILLAVGIAATAILAGVYRLDEPFDIFPDEDEDYE